MISFQIIRHAELVSASIPPSKPMFAADKWTLKQVQGDGVDFMEAIL